MSLTVMSVYTVASPDSPTAASNRMQVLEGLRDLPFAPSVGLHQVPGTDLAEATGIRVRQDDEESDVSDLDVEIARTL